MQGMNSFLIVSKDAKLSQDYSLEICKNREIDILDINIFNRDSLNKDKKTATLSIGIEDIRTLKQKIFLKPIKSILKATIIHDAQMLTVEAQNAMLKILEEPPNNTLIILTTNSIENLLTTILSRCKLIEITSRKNLTQDQKNIINNQLENLKNLEINSTLYLAEQISKNREEAMVWLENMILVLRERLVDSVEKGSLKEEKIYSHYIKEFQKTNQILKTTNINLRMSLEILFLSLTTH